MHVHVRACLYVRLHMFMYTQMFINNNITIVVVYVIELKH